MCERDTQREREREREPALDTKPPHETLSDPLHFLLSSHFRQRTALGEGRLNYCNAFLKGLCPSSDVSQSVTKEHRVYLGSKSKAWLLV